MTEDKNMPRCPACQRPSNTQPTEYILASEVQKLRDALAGVMDYATAEQEHVAEFYTDEEIAKCDAAIYAAREALAAFDEAVK